MNRKRKIVVGSAVAAAVVLGGGAFAAAQVLGDNDVDMAAMLPASAIGYLEVDLNPSIEQKAAALSLGSKLEALQGDDAAKGASLQESLAQENFEGVDYEADVKSWIGTQFAAAPITPDTETAVSLYSVKDHQKAEAALPKLNATEKHYVLEKDHLVITDSQSDHDAYAAALAEGRLADNADFTGDRKAMEDNVAFAWMDLGRLEVPEDGSFTDVPEFSGRFAAAVSLAADSVNLDAKTFGFTVEGVDDFSTQATGTPALGELAADTVGGIGIADISNSFRKNWDGLAADPDAAGEIEGALGPIEHMLGVTLPEDVDKILGENLAVGYEDGERVRIVTHKSDAETWDAIVDVVGTLGGDGAQSTAAAHGDNVHFVYNGDAEADAGRLADNPLYAKALPDADAAQFAAWLDLDRIQKLSDEPDTAENEGVVGATIAYDKDKAEHNIAVRWILK